MLNRALPQRPSRAVCLVLVHAHTPCCHISLSPCESIIHAKRRPLSFLHAHAHNPLQLCRRNRCRVGSAHMHVSSQHEPRALSLRAEHTSQMPFAHSPTATRNIKTGERRRSLTCGPPPKQQQEQQTTRRSLSLSRRHSRRRRLSSSFQHRSADARKEEVLEEDSFEDVQEDDASRYLTSATVRGLRSRFPLDRCDTTRGVLLPPRATGSTVVGCTLARSLASLAELSLSLSLTPGSSSSSSSFLRFLARHQHPNRLQKRRRRRRDAAVLVMVAATSPLFLVLHLLCSTSSAHRRRVAARSVTPLVHGAIGVGGRAWLRRPGAAASLARHGRRRDDDEWVGEASASSSAARPRPVSSTAAASRADIHGQLALIPGR